MLSRFHTIPACLGRTDRQTNGRTDGRTNRILYQYRASVFWRAIKTAYVLVFKYHRLCSWDYTISVYNPTLIVFIDVGLYTLIVYSQEQTLYGSGPDQRSDSSKILVFKYQRLEDWKPRAEAQYQTLKIRYSQDPKIQIPENPRLEAQTKGSRGKKKPNKEHKHLVSITQTIHFVVTYVLSL